MDPRLVPSFLVAIAFEVLFPLLLGLWLARRFRVPWKLFGYGALIFFLSQVLTRIPALSFLEQRLAEPLQLSSGYWIAWIAFASLTAGLFEEGGRYLGYRFLWRDRDKDWEGALMYGAGHGGLESMLLVGGLSILSLLNAIYVSQTDPVSLPSDQAALLLQAREALALVPWWSPLVGALERLMVMAIQLSLSVLVVQVFLRGRFYWWWLALGYHTLVNFASQLVLFLSSSRLPETWTVVLTEAAVLISALFSAWIILRLRPKQDSAAA